MSSISSALHRVKRAIVPVSKHMAANALIDRNEGCVPVMAELFLSSQRLIDGTLSPQCSLLVRTADGFRLATPEEEAEYALSDAW